MRLVARAVESQRGASGRARGRPSPPYLRLVAEFPLRRITAQRDYEAALAVLSKLGLRLDKLESTPAPPRLEIRALRDYLHPLLLLVTDFEARHSRAGQSRVTARDRLEFLMEEHGLRQADLRDELGGQPVASEILSGKRRLNLRQIRALARRFQLPPAVFIDA